MADILIKNMTLPVDNAILHLKINADGDVVEIFDGRSLFNGVKAIELPEHGDLKDANAILRWLNAKADNRIPVTVGEIFDFIEKQPIIVEASE